jgi:phytol kinase
MSKLGFEAKRKFVHALGFAYVLIYWLALKLLGHQIAMLILLSVLITFITIEFFRIKEHMRIPVFHVLWRPKEENTLGGQVYFMLGIILALGLFEFKIALAVILMTVLGDMAAAIFGIAFGKNWIKSLPETAWEGIIAEFIVDIAIGLFIIGDPIIAIPMALMATIVETIFPHVDDNLAIPVFAGFVGQGLKLIFP